MLFGTGPAASLNVNSLQNQAATAKISQLESQQRQLEQSVTDATANSNKLRSTADELKNKIKERDVVSINNGKCTIK